MGTQKVKKEIRQCNTNETLVFSDEEIKILKGIAYVKKRVDYTEE